MGILSGAVPVTDTFFKYPFAPMLGIYATPYFMGIQHELRDYKWTYLLVGSQYLASRWREVQLNNDIMRLQHYILQIVGQQKRPPRTALRALHATYKRLRKVYALRPESQTARMLEQWRTAAIPALALMYLSDESDLKFKAPLQQCVRDATRIVEEYRTRHPCPTIVLPQKLEREPEPIVNRYNRQNEWRRDPNYLEMKPPEPRPPRPAPTRW